MKAEKIIAIILAIWGLVLCPSLAEATLITIEIEAVVDRVDDPFGYLEGKVQVGTFIEGTYTYDPSVLRLPGHRYEFSFPCGVSLIAGGLGFAAEPSQVDFEIGIGNDHSQGDTYFFISHSNLPLSNGTHVGGISWILEDSTGKALSSDALPTTAPALGDWGFNFLDIGGGTRARPFAFAGHVTSAELVPEPATAFLFGVGILLLRKRK